MKPLNVVSLFDGMGCLRLALDRSNIPVSNYYASEIEQEPISVCQLHYPDVEQLGDVNGWRGWDINWSKVDLIGAGSPCQGFSIGGNGLNFDDPRSKLLFVFLDILNHAKEFNPDVKFLFENVKMNKKIKKEISSLLGVEPVFINSSLVSAQSRQRLYWANWEFTKPADKGIVMADILEPGYYSTRDKSYCIDANYQKGSRFRRYFFKHGRQLVLENGYMPQNMTMENANDIMRADGNRWRILTPLECERLQTVPDGYTAITYDKYRYKMLGNGWTIDVICHILESYWAT